MQFRKMTRRTETREEKFKDYPEHMKLAADWDKLAETDKWFGIVTPRGKIVVKPATDWAGRPYLEPAQRVDLPGTPYFVVVPPTFKFAPEDRADAVAQASQILNFKKYKLEDDSPAARTGKQPSAAELEPAIEVEATGKK